MFRHGLRREEAIRGRITVIGTRSYSRQHTGSPADEETTTSMPATLQEILLAPDAEPKVIDDCLVLIQQQLSDMSGISGTAVKLAYKTVNTFMPGHVRFMVGSLLPGMVASLQPYWADLNAAGGTEFGDYLSKRGDEVSEALLSVTDARARASDRPVIIKAYNSVRGNAGKHIQAALPRVGDLVLKHAG
jgi:hypothetical protein